MRDLTRLTERVRATARRVRLEALLGASLLVAACAPGARAAPFIWDQDQDRIDDRIATVHLLGYQYSFDQADTLLRQRIAVERLGGGLTFGVFVVYDHTPTSTDLQSLTLLGIPVLHRFEAIAVVRSVATYPQVQLAAALPGVVRVEAAEVLYPLVRVGAAALGVRDPSGQVFPTWAGSGGGDGSGVVIAFIDTAINDAPDGSYPGHESLIGRCLGGASFVSADSLLDTPPGGSVNPVDRGGSATQAHGTHVAGIALGSGGPTGYAMGVAPGAWFVDVKALSDAGSGTEVPEAIDWCIHNRARNWGGPAGSPHGIGVINLSLSSVDPSDGRDVASALAARAVELGIVVVASVGNDGSTGRVPSPAGGAGVIAVGAFDDQRTPLEQDDQLASFSNRGPRADDGDGDLTDEQKPDLVAPGVAVLSADGDLSSDGTHYRRLSGTSMATAFVSGAAALLLGSYPALTPGEIANLLRVTASRRIAGAPATPAGFDPRWSAGLGFGAPDLVAARLELEQPQRSQIDRLELGGAGSTITASLLTQRERGAASFVIERAPDASGLPAAFAPYDSLAAAGDSSLAGPVNRHVYPFTWAVPADERGVPFWYRAAYTEGGVRYDSAPRRFVGPAGPSLATIELTIAHNAYDTDVTGSITAGGGSGVPLPGSSAAVSSDWINGTSVTGNIAWTFRIEVADPAAAASLPPGPDSPWVLAITEGGYLDRSGQLRDYRLIWHAPGGDQTYVGGPVPQPTIEGATLHAAVPGGVLGVGAPRDGSRLSVAPNPVRAGAVVTFTRPSPDKGNLVVFDLGGRRVAEAPFLVAGGHAEARWATRDAGGRPIEAGMYFARAGSSPALRVVVLRR